MNFYEVMEKKVFIKGDVIFERGSPSTYFYVLKSGKVWFMMNQDQLKHYPFMEV
jgi:CRP-like cAMP-binding protein